MINIAIIGCGEMGALHAESLQKIPTATLYAGGDVLELKAESFRKRPGITYSTSNPAATFNDPKIDAVYIASTTDSHLSLFRQAVKSGKHILIEKPLALSAEQAYEIYQLSSQSHSIWYFSGEQNLHCCAFGQRALLSHDGGWCGGAGDD